MTDEIRLHGDGLRAAIAPAKGAGLLCLEARRGAAAAWIALTPDARRADCDLEWASFLMVPYSNRIADGRFVFGGETCQLDAAGAHAIHGDVRNRPWRVEEAEENRLRLSFRSVDHAGVNWPWPFETDVVYAIDGDRFASTLRLRNAGETPMPAGFGFHPYFNRWPTRRGEEARLAMRYDAIYPDARGDRIPSGPAEPVREAMDFSNEKAVDPTQFFDCCACGYDGGGRIAWPETGACLHFACDPLFSHLVLYNPGGKPYFAVEPVTNANDGVNLLARGDSTSGVAALAPGESLEGTFTLRVAWDDAR